VSLLDDWQTLKEDFPKYIVLIQCGVFYETYQEDAQFLSDICELKSYKRSKREITGFPISRLSKYVAEIEALGYQLVVVDEMGWSGKAKLRGISYVTGKPEYTRIVNPDKSELVSPEPRKKGRKTKQLMEEVSEIRSKNKVDLVLTQIGYMFNVFEDDAKKLNEALGIKVFNRYGYLTAGFPTNAQSVYFQRLLKAGFSFATYIEIEQSRFGSIRKLGEVHKPKSSEETQVIAPISRHPIPTSKRDAAIQLAKFGFYVLPLVAKSKKPLISDWQKKATTNPLQIIAWWEEHPDANIGIACEVSNLIIVDLDHSKGQAAPEKWANLAATSGEDVFKEICRMNSQNYPEDTYTVETPNGGKHLYFHDGGKPIKQGAEVNGWWKVDTRSKGGYIVAEGSEVLREDKTIGKYRSISSIDGIQEFPAWLREELAPKTPEGATWRGSREPNVTTGKNPKFSAEFALQVLKERSSMIANTPLGRRNHELVRHSCYIGKIIGAGVLDERLAKDSLLEAALKSGLDRHESITAIQHGVTYGIRNTWPQ